MVEFLEKSLDDDTTRREVLTVAIQRMIDAEMSLPKILHHLSKITDILQIHLGKNSALVVFFKEHAQVLDELKTLAHNPCKKGLEQAKNNIKRMLKRFSFEEIEKEFMTNMSKCRSEIVSHIQKNMNKKTLNHQDWTIQEIYSDLLYLFSNNNFSDKILKNRDIRLLLSDNGALYKNRIQAIMDLINMDVDTAIKGGTTRQFLDGVFHGKYPVSSLIETRLHGVEDGDIQIEADDSKLTEKTSLGEGSANEVFLCKYSNGHSFVFKPELSGLVGLRKIKLGGGYAYSTKTKLYHQNIASHKCAELFGLQDTIVTAKAGVLKGQFGLFMEVAPGINMATSERRDKLKSQINAKTDKTKLLKNLFLQFNKLQWLDLLTGQGDRHAGNFMLKISDDKNDCNVSLKGIDNDACFSEHLTGIHKYMITHEQNTYLVNNLKKSKKEFDINLNNQNKNVSKYLPQKNMTIFPKTAYIVDMNKIPLDSTGLWVGYAIKKTIGFQSCSLPSYIGSELYNKLQNIKIMSHSERVKFITTLLGKHISKKAIEAFNNRLNELISYADTLNNDNKVLNENGQSDFWKEIYNNAQEKANDLEKSIDKNIHESIYKDSARKTCKDIHTSDYFFKFMKLTGAELDIQ